jgi:toxin ParE1/3/4
MSGYVLSSDADEDLQAIYVFSMQEWGNRQAALYLNELYDTFERIARLPAIGRQRGELAEDIRSVPHGPHVIFYRPWEGEVAIVRILHGSRDIVSVFSVPDPPLGSSDRAG